MQLNEKQIQVTEELAELFFTPREVAYVIEVDPEQFHEEVMAETTDIAKHYYKGWYTGELKLRKQIAQQSEAGSSPAQTTMLGINKKSKSKISYE